MASTRRHAGSIVFVLVVLGGLLGASFAFGYEPRLGLDLTGGVAVTLTAPEGTKEGVLDKTVEILQRRVDAAGVAEPEIAREGSNNVLVQLPGSEEPKRLLDLIGRTAQLQFRQVSEVLPPGSPQFASATVSSADTPSKEVILPGADGSKYRLAPARLTGGDVRDATAVLPPNATGGSDWEVSLRFDREGSRKWASFTGELACRPAGDPQRQVAVILDARVESAPQIAEDVECNRGIEGGDTRVTGSFTENEARDLGLVLTTGALPVALEQSEVRIVSPTLGRDALKAGLLAGAIGLALVLVYVLLYYRSLGLQTWFGLAVFGGIIYGLVVLLGKAIGWNLTLAGIAGLIVAVGIATDSYIVFFERIKEEVHTGRSIRTSVSRGFKHAWRTLVAANFVTILAAIVLYFLTVGPVRGFALALGVATTLDLGITFFLTKPLASVLGGSRFFSEARVIGMRRALEGSGKGLLRKIYRSEFNLDIVGRRRFWFIFSGALVLVSVLALIPQVRGLTFGIDFRGGTILRLPVDESVEVTEIRDALRKGGHGDAVVQVVQDPTGARQAQVQTEALSPKARDEVADALAKTAGAEVSEIDVQSVGEKWGQQITSKAVRGLVIFLVLVVIYMSLRLEPKMAAAGIAALLHDLVIVAGVYALVGFEVTPATVIASMTILGYSLYDTVVVFDKIQENAGLPANARRRFGAIANDSVNQVLMRSINTSLTVLLPVGSLLVVGSFLLGADTLKDLALALLVGIAAGTYSSIFVAAPLLSVLKERESRYRRVAAATTREFRPEARVEPVLAPDLVPDASEEQEETRTPAVVYSQTGPRRQPKRVPRSKRKGKR